MKKVLSLFILCNIFLGSFFAQEVNTGIWESISIVHSTGSKSNKHHHKTPVFTELSSESKDSVEKTTPDIQFTHYYNQYFQNKYVPHQFCVFYLGQLTELDNQNSLPLFIKNSSMLI